MHNKISKEKRKMTFIGLHTERRKTIEREPKLAPVKSEKYIVPLRNGRNLKANAMKRLVNMNAGMTGRARSRG